jgi:hypothetical protein
LARRRLFYFFLAEEDYFTGSTLMAQPTSPSDQRPEQMPTLCFSISILFCLRNNILFFKEVMKHFCFFFDVDLNWPI